MKGIALYDNELYEVKRLRTRPGHFPLKFIKLTSQAPSDILIFHDDTSVGTAVESVYDDAPSDTAIHTDTSFSNQASISFIDESNVKVVAVAEKDISPDDEYETDSDDEECVDTGSDVHMTITRSGRPVRAFARFDM